MENQFIKAPNQLRYISALKTYLVKQGIVETVKNAVSNSIEPIIAQSNGPDGAAAIVGQQQVFVNPSAIAEACAEFALGLDLSEIAQIIITKPDGSPITAEESQDVPHEVISEAMYFFFPSVSTLITPLISIVRIFA